MTETPSAELSILPVSSPTAETIAADPAIVSCVNDARFVEDLTVPDGYQAEPGEVLDKQWRVINAGSCDWEAGYRLVRVDDGPIEARAELALYPARAGETGVWTVEIKVPSQAGDQVASWQAQSPEGVFFGDQVFVLIKVAP